jgi:uncharacterized protein YjbI with pentapeptide repeats
MYKDEALFLLKGGEQGYPNGTGKLQRARPTSTWTGPSSVLSAADLHGIDLSESKLMMARFNGADLRGTKLGKAGLRGAKLRGAKLTIAQRLRWYFSILIAR